MSDIKNLYDTIVYEAYSLGSGEQKIPDYIIDNLKYEFFEWQEKAFKNFLTYQLIKQTKNSDEPIHLMFNMATGSGKTLLMAAAILYFYQQGYKHFIFFVNQSNIVDKTQNNFINKFHTKYLFKEKIVINDRIVNIKEVDAFSDNPRGIEIKFTTIQKLYNDVHIEKENQTTLADLHKKNIVMLADEAHHLNTDTKSNNGSQEELVPTELTERSGKKDVERKGWEHTVIKLILNKNGQKDSKNILLEFTATIPETEAITRKYQDKIIYKFGLKEFLSAGYTKEINLISSNLEKKERILQALLFHWYRHKLAIKHSLSNFKPIILFRSKTIEESKADYQYFLDFIQDLSVDDFAFLSQILNNFSNVKQPSLYEMGQSRTEQVLGFINRENISIAEIVRFIKSNFSKRQVIITNSKTNKTQKEKTTEDQNNLLNSLENANNHIRAIFTVQRLTEGWDVLNLYDIVRLYEGRDEGADRAGNRRAGSATIAEKQLIGRGVRYYPFPYQDKALNKRKFDENLDHELRVLEELFFYSTNDHRYIDELKRELKKDGYIKDERVFKTFQLKEDFKKTNFYKTTKVWKNERIDNPDRRKKTLTDFSSEYIKPYKIKDFSVREEIVDFKLAEKPLRQNQPEENLTPNCLINFKDIEKHIFLKAMNIKAKEEDSLFQFEKLKEELKITSIDDLQKPEFLGNFQVPVILNKNQKYEDVSNEEKLNMTLSFLTNIFALLENKITPQIGSQEFKPYSFEKLFGQAKTKSIDQLNEHDEVARENNWYVLDGFVGTNEEQALVDFIKNTFFNLELKYEEIYLLRNEEIYTIYDFEKGRGFCPDFILFLKSKNQDKIFYQVFIEPKGSWAHGFNQDLGTGKEGWKEDFLKEISIKYGSNKVVRAENKDYRLLGLPFFNTDNNAGFLEKWKEIID